MMSLLQRFVAVRSFLAGALVALAPGADAQQPGDVAVRRGVAVRPAVVTVGDPFVVTVRIQAPAGATVEFPAGPDTTAAVELLDPRTTRGTTGTGVVDQTATYRMAAWDVDTLPLRLGDVRVRVGGVERVVSLGDLTVYVRSVLPADSALRVPKPPRAPLADAGAWWWRLWPYLLALLAVVALLWWLLRRRRGKVPQARLEADPYVHAEAEFDRLAAAGLVEAGERGRLVALAVDVLRTYLAARLPAATTSLTSGELLDVVSREPVVPAHRLAPLLGEADLVKFARHPVSADSARAALQGARVIVREVEEAMRAERDRAAAARELQSSAAAKREAA